jgi:hypothetical protein
MSLPAPPSPFDERKVCKKWLESGGRVCPYGPRCRYFHPSWMIHTENVALPTKNAAPGTAFTRSYEKSDTTPINAPAHLLSAYCGNVVGHVSMPSGGTVKVTRGPNHFQGEPLALFDALGQFFGYVSIPK